MAISVTSISKLKSSNISSFNELKPFINKNLFLYYKNYKYYID